jgi:hypothetical protein
MPWCATGCNKRHWLRLFLDQSAWRDAQNRAFYAMFYAVHTLLATRLTVVARDPAFRSDNVAILSP